MTQREISEDSTPTKLPVEIEIVIETKVDNTDDLNTKSAVSNITECDTGVAVSSCSSNSVGNKRPRNCYNVNAYDQYKCKYHTRPTFNQDGSAENSYTQSTDPSIKMNNKNCMFVLGDGTMVNHTDKKIGKAAKPHPVQETSSGTKISEKYSRTTSTVRVIDTVLSKSSYKQDVDLQQASASQLLTALQQKGYTTIADLSKLAKIDIGVPNHQDVSSSQDDYCPSNVIN